MRHDVLTVLHGLRNDRNTLKEALAHGSDHDQSPPDPLAPDA
jgi:hypothetical protein